MIPTNKSYQLSLVKGTLTILSLLFFSNLPYPERKTPSLDSDEKTISCLEGLCLATELISLDLSFTVDSHHCLHSNENDLDVNR